MILKNPYAIRARISAHQFRRLARLFALDLDATQIAALTGLNRNTVNRYLRGIRQRMAEACEQTAPFDGEIEVDESYFGARHTPGKRGRGGGGGGLRFEISDYFTLELEAAAVIHRSRPEIGDDDWKFLIRITGES